MQTTKSFILKYKIKMLPELTDQNPNWDPKDKYPRHHWNCLFRCGSRRATFYFSCGQDREPKAAEVLDCLAMDADLAERTNTFVDFVSESYGKNEKMLFTEWQQQERAFQGCREVVQKLRRLLKDLNVYQELLYATERL